MRAHFAPVDWLILAAYVVALVVVGFWKRPQQNAGEYLIANRSLGLPVFVATLVATWYGGILGAGEYAYDSGIVAWTTNGLPYYVFATLFALFLARRVQSGAFSVYTIPDKLAAAYDRRTALAGAALTYLYAVPATYVLMVGTILRLLFGWPLIVAMLVGIAFSVVYVYKGGFLSDVRVNTLQFLLMFAGFIAIVALCLHRFGGYRFLAEPGRLPATHLQLLGGNDIWYAVVWFFIALTTLVDPGFHQRCYAARTPRVAAIGILCAVLCWAAFDLLSTTAGLFSRALLPNLGTANATLAYPALAERVLPAGLKGLFYVGMLAPMMASTVSYTFISALTIGRDFIWRLKSGEADAGAGAEHVPRYTRWGLLATSATAIVIALAIPSVVKQWYFFGSILVPGVLIPLVGAYLPDTRYRARPSFAFWSMVLGAGTSFACLLWGWTHGGFDNPSFPLGWQPMFPGLGVAALVYLGGIRRPQTYPAFQATFPKGMD